MVAAVVGGCAPDPVPRFSDGEEAALAAGAALVDGRFVDAADRVRTIIDLEPWAAEGFRDRDPPLDGLSSHHRPRLRHLAAELRASYGVKAISATSWVGDSIVAYLDDDQLAALSADPRVARLTADQPVALSALWNDGATASGDTLSWGVAAMGGPRVATGQARVYVVDVGVGRHADLDDVVVERLAPSGLQPVGCFPHATHVAGIIAARDNGRNVAGVLGGAPIVSVSTTTTQASTLACGDAGAISNASVEAALDVVRARIAASGRVGVVNLSMNRAPAATANLFAASASTGAKLRALATPGAGYPGAFVVESAGNRNADACAWAYDGQSASDGVMVVGALEPTGQPVVPLDGLAGFRNGDAAATEPGSNYGPCVEAWAPGNRIVSTWAANPQLGATVYSAQGPLSGTSMAAPMVAGLAASLVERYGLTTPAQVEQFVRLFSVDLGARDPAGLPVRMPTQAGAVGSAQTTMQWMVDGAAASSYTGWSDRPFTLSFDSYGAASCTIDIYAGYYAYSNGYRWWTSAAFFRRYAFGARTLAANTYFHVARCTTAAGVSTTALFVANIRPAPPPVTVRVFVDNTDRTNLTSEVATGSTFGLRWTSTGATSCMVQARYWQGFGFATDWYTATNLPTAYDWGQVSLPPPWTFDWRITCSNERESGWGSTTVTIRDLAPLPAGLTGWFDGLYPSAGHGLPYGWACAPAVAQQLRVLLYAGAPAEQGGSLLAEVLANQPSEPAVAAICGTGGLAHRWSWPVPAAVLARVAGQQIYAYVRPPTGYASPLVPLTRTPGASFALY